MSNYFLNRNINIGELLKITKPDGSVVFVKILSFPGLSGGTTSKIKIDPKTHNFAYNLDWYNCYSFSNGVESNRIRDNFNQPFLTPGVRVSTVFEDYKEEQRSNSLIFSGIYNSIGSVNNLNQFIQAEKITKELNPTYGSIQKLHTRDSDLVVLCEDKVLRILANKDAVFNADGNPQLTANNNVLGQSIPFVGEYGISKNPESFASEAYRSYFTDKQRGVVLRLSKDGLTPISLHGMKDYFKDNLKLSNNILGSYDKKKDEYNVSLTDKKVLLKQNLVENGDFTNNQAFNSDTGDTGWFSSGGNHWTWDSTYKNAQSDADPHDRINYRFEEDIRVGDEFEISYTIGHPNLHDPSVDPLDSAYVGPLEGRIWVTFHDNRNHYKTISPSGNSVIGENKIVITMLEGYFSWPFGADLANTIGFHIKNHDGGPYFNGTIDNVSVKKINQEPETASFSESVKGWTSFKSFIPENSVSCSGNYYTFKDGKAYEHYNEDVSRNNFYGVDYNSSVNVLLNDAPSNIKTYNTLDYEGSKGWIASSIKTDQSEGVVDSFVEKENKYYNYIRGIDKDIHSKEDFKNSNVQGVGILFETPVFEVDDGTGVMIMEDEIVMSFNKVNVSAQVGDDLYYVKSSNITSGDVQVENVVKYGPIKSLTSTSVTIDQDANLYVTSLPVFEAGDFILFAKSASKNKSSVSGYYADVELTNSSKEKAELFTIASEIQESSK